MFRRLAAAAALLLTLIGCSTAAPSSTGAPAQLQFTATTLDGADFSGASLLGKPAVFWFWAPWCPTCQREAPMVGQAADAHPTVTFVGVGSSSDVAAMKAFVDKYPVKSLVQLADTSGAVWAKFGVTQQPAFAFVPADGHVDLVKGPMSAEDLDQRVDALGGR